MDFITHFLEELAQKIPVSIFAFIGSVIDEIIAIVPSPMVPLLAGSIAYEQGEAFMFLFVVALTGTVGKTLATLVTYWLSDKIEDVFTGSKLGKILGIEKSDIEKYGKMFNGTRRDEVIMVILRMLPFMPTLPVSVVAGVLKIPLTSFIVTTFIGTYLRFTFYLIVAYQGSQKYEGILGLFDKTNKMMELMIILFVLGFMFLYLRKNWEGIYNRIQKLFVKKNKKDNKNK